MKRILLQMAAGLAAAAVFFCVPATAVPVVSAKSAVVLDMDSGRVLYAQRADERSLIASTTKIMTGLLIAERCDLNACVVVPPQAVGTEGSSLYLQQGQRLRVRTLLYGMMLHSGNDAAVALAIHCAGSVPAFVAQMNMRAVQIHLSGTHFTNPHGLDDAVQYSTAADLARLTAYAMKNPVFRQVVSTRTVNMEGRSFTNHNKLLWRYPGAIGVKTGYTRKAGRILVSAAQRDGRRLVAVTIQDPNDWEDHIRLLDYGFSAYSPVVLARTGDVLGEVPVIGGAETAVQAVTATDLTYPVTKEEQVHLQIHLPPFVYAPVLAGTQAGTVAVEVDGICRICAPLYWKYSVFEEV